MVANVLTASGVHGLYNVVTLVRDDCVVCCVVVTLDILYRRTFFPILTSDAPMCNDVAICVH